MPEIDNKFRPISNDNILFKPLSDGAILFEPDSEVVHTLNPSAAYIWIHCDGNHTISDIITLIKKNFSEFELQPKDAVNSIIKEFQALGLVSSE
ncbi:MAG TPA: hypothetical protein DHW42_09675 [Candidatus Marinimicrobia bacterium]|nr:hypothetical protein [Candidatus Neomarinimicrobiota bacterium]